MGPAPGPPWHPVLREACPCGASDAPPRPHRLHRGQHPSGRLLSAHRLPQEVLGLERRVRHKVASSRKLSVRGGLGSEGGDLAWALAPRLQGDRETGPARVGRAVEVRFAPAEVQQHSSVPAPGPLEKRRCRVSAAPTLGGTACRQPPGGKGDRSQRGGSAWAAESTRVLSEEVFLVGPRESLSFKGL